MLRIAHRVEITADSFAYAGLLVLLLRLWRRRRWCGRAAGGASAAALRSARIGRWEGSIMAIQTRSCYFGRDMRRRAFISIFLAVCISVCGQSANSKGQPLPKDPEAILSAAAPFYNFDDPTLKPWHLEASYQLYDASGKPGETGTFEYWWVSPTVYRSSWTRLSATRRDWHTADGKHLYAATGEDLTYFELKLQQVLVDPLGGLENYHSARFRTVIKSVHVGRSSYPCIAISPIKNPSFLEPFSGAVTYCFDPDMPPVLRITDTDGTIADLNDIVRLQKKFLVREIEFGVNRQKLLTAKVVAVTDVSWSDPAMSPPQSAHLVQTETVLIPKMQGESAHKTPQVNFPEAALDERKPGEAVVQITIGTDGRVRNAQLVWSSSPEFSKTAIEAASGMRFKPPLMNGEPVQEMRLITVLFKVINRPD